MVKTKKDKVSIIVPVYNDEKYICSCLDSIIHQTYNQLEIILVDDASADSSLEICKRYAAMDDRIKILHNSRNCGLSGSREIGYRYATGEWLCFMDHDDSISHRAIEYLVNCADENADIVAAKFKNILNEKFEQYSWDTTSKVSVLTLSHDMAVDTLGNFGKYDVPECLWGKIYRRTLFEKIDIKKYKQRFSQVYFEDVLLTSALVKACREIKIVDVYMYIHRVDYNSVSMSPNALEFNLQTARTVDIVLGRVDEPYAGNAYARIIQNYLLVFSKNWYLIWKYHNKNEKLLHEMEELFEKYYKIYQKLEVHKPLATSMCIRLFKINKVFFCLSVCKLWFGYISKLKYQLKSR